MTAFAAVMANAQVCRRMLCCAEETVQETVEARPVMIRSDEPVDVLIAGGGFAGLTLAIALRQGLGPQVSVTVADPMLGKSHADDERASAIVAAARRLFEALGIWPGVADDKISAAGHKPRGLFFRHLRIARRRSGDHRA